MANTGKKSEKDLSPISMDGRFALDDHQRKIWEGLTKVNERLGRLYIGSLKVLADKSNPVRFILAAHGLRALGFEDRDDGKEQKKIQDHKVRIKNQIIANDPLGGVPDHLLEEISRRWVKDLHVWFSKVSKGFVDVSQKEFEEKLNELEKILFSVSNPHFEIVDNIDQLLTIKKPKKKEVEYLKTLLTSWSTYAYFFEKVEENWLPLLAAADFFKKPPVQGIWPESRYLTRIASKNPEKVIDIIKLCPSTENPSVHDDFVQASMNMPIQIGQQIISLIQKGQWLQSKYHILLPHKLADFMTRLAKNGSIELKYCYGKNYIYL